MPPFTTARHAEPMPPFVLAGHANVDSPAIGSCETNREKKNKAKKNPPFAPARPIEKKKIKQRRIRVPYDSVS